MIENTILITKDRLENRLYYYPGNKVGQEHEGLEDLFKHLVGQFVDHDCKSNRQEHT